MTFLTKMEDDTKQDLKQRDVKKLTLKPTVT